MRPSAARRRRFHAYWLGVLLLAVGLGLRAQTIVGPDQMNYCDTATFTTTITNQSVTLSACLLEITRSYTESGVDYVPGSTVITLHDSTILNDDPTASAWDIDTLLGEPYTLPPTKSITIAYDLVSSCAAVSGTEQVTVNYEDCADPGVPLQNVSSVSIEILPGAIVVSKTPSLQDARVGDLVTWTITVENTGLGRVDNVTITDVLGPGLAYSSSTGGGSNAGQTTTWDVSSIPLGESESVDLTAEVIACKGLYNDVDAAFGCGPSDICFDTAIDEGTATASLNLIVDNPALSFTPPNVTVGYCTDETAGLIQITNSGAGTARNVKLCCDFAYLEVDPARLPADTTYATRCFLIPDIPPNSTFDLTFYVLHPDVDWCGPGPSGSNTFQLTYTNDCSIPFVAYPQFSTLSSEPGPTLSVSKTALNSPLHLGETGAYDIKVEYTGSVDCGGGSPGPVTIVDTYPEGFTVVDPAGGTVDGDARTITWAYDPADPPFDETIQLQAPSNCGYCAQPGGGSDANSLTATGTDCCGCPIISTASADTTILCEGYGDIEYFTSTMELAPTTTIRCADGADPYAIGVTHTYTFFDYAALDDLLLGEFVYFLDGNDDLQYGPVPPAAPAVVTVDGTPTTILSLDDGTPGGQLRIQLDDDRSVRNRTVVYAYTMTVLGLDDPSCQATSYPLNAGIDLIGTPTAIGFCGTMYADPTQRQVVTAQPPAMNVEITGPPPHGGIPEIQEFCATYPVTITLTRTSALAKPYDTRLVLTNNSASILDFSGADCSGGTHSPTDGTTCTGPHVDGDTYEWRYADLFDNENETAQITFDVSIPCSGPYADLSVVAIFDDLCHDDVTDSDGTGYGTPPDACSTGDADEALLSLSANVFTRKSPEILYATTRGVEWTLVVHNTGNAAAYNVWVDDTLGSGLVFDSDNTDPAGATMTANEDHLGSPINGATFLFDQVDPGELITITFAATLDACDDLTNHVEVSWGCGGSDCQAEETDDSIVVVPPANLIATTFSPTPVPMCAKNSATTIVKNAGVSTVYGIVNTVTLPNGLTYLTGPPEELYPEVRVNGGSWSRTGEPDIDGQTLTWTSTETPELASADPKDVIEIRFNYTAFCGFTGGNLSFQAGYEDPCGNFHTSNTGTFSLGLEPASLSTTLRQIDPAPGEALDCGGEATWEIDVVNTGTVALAVIQVEAILGDGLTYVSSQGDPIYGPADGGTDRGWGQKIYWEFEDLPVGATATLQVTAQATVGPTDCEALDIDVIATWGCGDDVGDSESFDADCTTTSPDTATISATRRPPLDLAASLSPDTIEACASTTELTLMITNNSTTASATDVDLEINLLAPLTYLGPTSATWPGGSSTDPPSGTPGPDLTWDLSADLGPGETLTLTFSVAADCYFDDTDIAITVSFRDCCGITQYDETTSVRLTSLLPVLTVDKTPPLDTDLNLNCYDTGDTVTWTVTVTNTGTGVADWVRLIDTLGSSLVIDSFTDLVDETPATVDVGARVGQVITWEADVSLAPGESLSTTVTAHAIQPSNDCSRSIRRNTAVATWGCGALAAPSCEYSAAAQDQSTVRVPNLTISPADIVPVFSCEGDGITPGSGQLQITVRNQGNGDAPISENFAITVTEPNSGFSVSDTFVGLGGQFDLEDNSPQTLTLDNWSVSCANCTYAITATLDTGDAVCECSEDDNAAVLNGTITLPDLVADSADLAVTCAADGQIRVQGPVTLRNDGCGNPVTGDISVRFRLFDGADCTGDEIDTFTETWTAVDIASGGGTSARDVDRIRPIDVCAVTQVTVRIEVDDNDVVCECSGDNNTLCVGPFALTLPDIAITSVNVNVPDVCNAGTANVTVKNAGFGNAPPGVVLRITGDATGEATTPAIAAGASTVVSVPLDVPLVCGPKSITVIIDPDDELCECTDSSNTTDVDFSVSDPDLVISAFAAACQPDGTIRITATVANDGDEASGDVTLHVLLDGTPIDTSVISLEPAETLPVDILTAPVSCGVEHTIRVIIDEGDEVCECDETNNVEEATATCPCPALSVDKIITDILRDGASIGTTGPIEPGDVVFYRYTITNVAAGTAFDVDFTDTLPAGLVTETDAPGGVGSYAVSDPAASGTLAIPDAVGAFTTSIAATIFGGETLVADYAVIATSGVEQGTDLINVAATTGEAADGTPIPGENPGLGDTSDGDSEDPDADDTGITVLGVAEPALSVDKTITDIVRPGEGSLGSGEPVEPGDIVFHQFVIRNVGAATAYHVEFTDTLPAGMVTETDAPGIAGSYDVSSPSVTDALLLGLTDGVGAFTTSIDATIAGGESLTAEFAALITSEIIQGVDLVNIAEATGFDGFGTEIPDENTNPAIGDTSDDDAEDPDADDTGIAVIGTEEPALSVDKIITDIIRQESRLGPLGPAEQVGPVEPGDVVFYRYTIRNVGLGTAYAVDFTDTLPTGLVTETDAPGIAGSYDVSSPSVTHAPLLGLTDGVGAFTTAIAATIAGGGQLVAEYTVFVTSDVRQGTDLINIAAAAGVDGAGNPIPGANADVGDTSDDDEEDGDADDTGITIIAPVVPALSVNKRVIDVLRGGASVGIVDPVLYGDVIVYEYTIRNVGLGTAYAVEFTDVLPAGLETETHAPGDQGNYSVDSPSASGTFAVPDGVGTFTTTLNATITGGGTLTATYTVLVTPFAPPALDLVNVGETTGEDGAGTEIPDENASIGDTSDDDEEDPDADDTGIASVRVGAPALVTTKTVASINRNGLALSGGTIEPGDLVTYEVTVTNVGNGPAQNVDLADVLPVGFVYAGATNTAWPGGSSTATPSGSLGPSLTWPLDANLDEGEELILRFDTRVTGNIVQGSAYTNTVTATGEDATGKPIPPDASDLVPEDDDPDDSSNVTLVGAVPALVTHKDVLNIIRDGRSLGPATAIETGDLVIYDLKIENVGAGNAYRVGLRDVLPTPFHYQPGSTEGVWPLQIGAYVSDPLGASGSTLIWDTNADLGPGDKLALRFTASIEGTIEAGTHYVNTLFATGEDAASRPISPNRIGDVPEDDDPDDQDDVTLIGGVAAPALVTTKRVAEIRRDGVRVNDNRIEEGDTVRFELTVRNVSTATAYAVGIDDDLPPEFAYNAGSTFAQWPGGSTFADPSSGIGLTWLLGATLQASDRIVLRFDAVVLGPLFDGNLYINRMHAFGDDGSGSPIPPDQQALVPSDTDPDDASQANLIARSSVVQGEGGEIIPVPVLRKRAEVLGDGICESSFAEADRLWFQTDIAMYAAAEFELLGAVSGGSSLLPEMLLPTWLRTVQAESADYARDNLLQVNALSRIGLTLSDGLRIRQHADALSRSPIEALEDRLAALARRAGLDPDDRPAGESWIVLEFAGGEPVYTSSPGAATASVGILGPYGNWTIVDEEIVSSALGMGLVKQAMEASSLLQSGRPLDRYVGLVLAEAMANKVLALHGDLTIRENVIVPYVPHVHIVDSDGLVVEDDASYLLDQLSLLWGLAEFVRFIQENPDAWSPEEPGLRAYLHARASQLIGEILTAIETRHLAMSGTYLDIAADALAEDGRASTVDVGLLLVALDATAEVVSPFDAGRVHHLAAVATEDLLSREEDGRFLAPEVDRELNLWALAQQMAGIRGLLIASEFGERDDLVTIAQSAFDVLEERLWIDNSGGGLYAAYLFEGATTACYTPLEIGLATGALRELAARSDEARSAHVLSRLSAFVRSIVDTAALQLSNAVPFGAELTVGSGRGTIGPLRYETGEALAPVLQQRLCLEVPDGASPCTGRNARTDDPWYQTDISMYAAYVLQDRMPQIEDYADANLFAVVLHSNLGVGFDDIPNLSETLSATLLGTGLSPIAVPYAAGSPRLDDEASLDWNPTTFDDRILASAVGMTLLREAQELGQLLGHLDDPKADLQASILLHAILQKLVALQDLVTSGPDGVDYVPHAARFAPERPSEWTVVDARSTLFDQLALLYGLSVTHELLADPRVTERVDAVSFSETSWSSVAEALLSNVLTTLERVHLDTVERVLVDEASPETGSWVLGGRVATGTLGLAASALEETIAALSVPAETRNRAMTLLTNEVGFLQRQLWEEPGVYHESWTAAASTGDEACEPDTLLGQLGALRALIAAHDVLALDPVWVTESLGAIEARFWDGDLLLYPSQLKTLAWCVTPLDLGMTVDTIDRAADLLDDEARAQTRDRLARHVDRILDALWLQLPSSSALTSALDSSEDPNQYQFAPVFDRSVCLRPRFAEDGERRAEPGDLIRYTVTAENATDEMFANLLLEDRLPEGVSLVSADPVGVVSDGTVAWLFDRFEPAEALTWSLTARVDESTALGQSLVNCVTLTYTNLAGIEQPSREACAETVIQTATEAYESILERATVSYQTDEAMRLATILEELARLGANDWTASSAAHDVSVANLGILLGESGLGLSLRYAPAVPTSENRETSLAESLSTFAELSDLPSAPRFGAPVFLPFATGTPILESGKGFIEGTDSVTPAALGHTLAREAVYLDDASDDHRLDAYLRQIVTFVAANQIEWLTTAMRPTESGGRYLPRSIRTSIVNGELGFSSVDEGTTVYGQASLLLGLTGIAQTTFLDEETRQLAQEFASQTLTRLALHRSEEGWTRALPAADGEKAVWIDLVVVAAALESAGDVLSRDRKRVLDLLSSVAEEALAQGEAIDPIEEAGRIVALLGAARALGEPRFSEEARDAWHTLRDAVFDPTLQRLVFSAGIRHGLTYTPEEAAVVFGMLHEVALSFPEERRGVYATATQILEQDILAARVQLADAAELWQAHLSVDCHGLAPVFGRYIGELPPIR